MPGSLGSDYQAGEPGVGYTASWPEVLFRSWYVSRKGAGLVEGNLPQNVGCLWRVKRSSPGVGRILFVEVAEMVFSNAEFEALLSDSSKRIDGDIGWSEDEDHSLSREFLVEVTSSVGWPLVVRGSYNPLIPALTYALILKTVGRIYALCLGKDHHNPTCERTGDRHKHRWTETLRDKGAYIPHDVTATASQIQLAWEQFLKEARITHNGVLRAYPPIQRGLF